jgi:hypothetical protein
MLRWISQCFERATKKWKFHHNRLQENEAKPFLAIILQLIRFIEQETRGRSLSEFQENKDLQGNIYPCVATISDELFQLRIRSVKTAMTQKIDEVIGPIFRGSSGTMEWERIVERSWGSSER